MQIQEYLEFVSTYYFKPKYIQTDPIRYLYLFKNKKEIELMGLIVSLFSYGNRSSIFLFLDNLIQILLPNPLEKILELDIKKIKLYYRFQSKKDIQIILEIFREIVKENYKESYIFFKEFDLKTQKENIYEYIDIFQNRIQKRIPTKFISYGIKHYFTFSTKSVAKRYCLFFRWMVRDKFPDFGIYSFIQKKYLIYPVDVHILNFALKHQIISSKNIKRKEALMITNFFKKLNLEDPLYYDFFITRDLMLNKKLEKI